MGSSTVYFALTSKVLLLVTPEAVKPSGLMGRDDPDDYVREPEFGGEVHNEIANASALGKNVVPLVMTDFDIPDYFMYLTRKYEFIHGYKLDNDRLRQIVLKRLQEGKNKEAASFFQTTGTKEFKNFVYAVMMHYYGSEFFTQICGQDFPVLSLKGKDIKALNSIKDFDCLSDYENSSLSDYQISNHQNYDQNPWYEEYSWILDGKIRYPNRPGYMLDEIRRDQDGLVHKVCVHVGTYAENIYSTHVLEYELYQAYLEHGKENLEDPDVWEKVRASLMIRNRIHGNVGQPGQPGWYDRMFSSLLCGNRHDALLSVQMLVVIKSSRTHKYELKMVERSTQVASRPRIYQFIPAGGFEILNDSDDNEYDDLELYSNFSAGCAVFREYLEELFNLSEFEGGGTGSIEERLLKDERIVEIETMLKNGTACLQFLGSVMDLSGLRHELSFVLVIKEEEYSKHRFIANEECKKGRFLENLTVDNFEEQSTVWKKIHGPSAAMWHLFKQTDLYRELLT